MNTPSVDLHRQTDRKASGKAYTYWVLRWRGPDGRRRGERLGSVNKLSKRQAEKLRKKKELELGMNPGRNVPARAPQLQAYVDAYLEARRNEVKPGTLELHEQTTRYLIGFFGASKRLDTVTRQDVRAFRTALAAGELAHVNERNRKLTAATVDLHLRNARTVFAHAVTDDVLLFNPFDRIAATGAAAREWHYVSSSEFAKLFNSASRPWQLLLALARWAGLRRGEALNLRWHNIDWDNNRLTIVGNKDWDVKDKELRVVPMCPELHALLLSSFELAEERQPLVIPAGVVPVQNVSRDFGVLCRRAKVPRYNKPLHTLRKSCLTDWAARFPMHVVQAWAGHSNISTTATFYLQVSETDYEKAAAEQMGADLPRNLPRLAKTDEKPAENEDAADSQPAASQELTETAGDRIRTDDVQLGKLAFYH